MAKNLQLKVYFSDFNIMILVPKNRGDGYLKTPLGHHDCPLAQFCRWNIKYDVCGLDGYLDIETSYIIDKDILIQTVIEPLAKFFEMTWQEVNSDSFYALLDIGRIRR